MDSLHRQDDTVRGLEISGSLRDEESVDTISIVKRDVHVLGRFCTDESIAHFFHCDACDVASLAIRPSETAQIAVQHREVCVCEDPCNNCRQRAAVTINSMADGDSDAFELMCNTSIVVVQDMAM